MRIQADRARLACSYAGRAPDRLCVYGPRLGDPFQPSRVQPDICDDHTHWVGSFSDAQLACLIEVADYLCLPVSQFQSASPPGGPQLISHLVDLNNPGDLGQLRRMVADCANAFVPQTGDPSIDRANTAAWFEQFFGFGLCDDQATLLRPDQIIGSAGPTSTPPVTARSCQ